MIRSVTMDTPRSGLIRATESVIREYIKENCESHLLLIQKLEDVSYNMWVESNTDFLDRSLLAVDSDDEDGFIWDDAFMPTSLSYPVTLDDEVCEFGTDYSDVACYEDDLDISSICSSIRPCDESGCWIGYLAGSEGESDTDSPGQERVYSTYKATSRLHSEESASNEANMIGQELSDVLDSQPSRKSSKCRLERNNVTGIESEMNIQQDWIILDSDFSEEICLFSEQESMSPKGIELGNSEVLDDNVRYGSEECENGPDIEAWSVLSLNITEQVYPGARRRLFGVDDDKVCDSNRTCTNSNTDVLSYLDPWARQSTGWVLFRLLFKILRYLMQKNKE